MNVGGSLYKLNKTETSNKIQEIQSLEISVVVDIKIRTTMWNSFITSDGAMTQSLSTMAIKSLKSDKKLLSLLSQPSLSIQMLESCQKNIKWS